MQSVGLLDYSRIIRVPSTSPDPWRRGPDTSPVSTPSQPAATRMYPAASAHVSTITVKAVFRRRITSRIPCLTAWTIGADTGLMQTGQLPYGRSTPLGKSTRKLSVQDLEVRAKCYHNLFEKSITTKIHYILAMSTLLGHPAALCKHEKFQLSLFQKCPWRKTKQNESRLPKMYFKSYLGDIKDTILKESSLKKGGSLTPEAKMNRRVESESRIKELGTKCEVL